MPKYLRLVPALVLLTLLGCAQPQSSGHDNTEINTSQEPQQTVIVVDPVIKKTKHGRIKIKPSVEYKISGKVCITNRNYFGWEGEFIPFDMILIWGDLAKSKQDDYLVFSFGGYEYNAQGGLNSEYVENHLKRFYIYPADENIFRALKTVKRQQKIQMEGLLIDAQLDYNERSIGMKSPLAPGMCEYFYVRKIKIGHDIYQ